MKLTYDSLLKHARSSNFHKHIEMWMEDGTMMRDLPEFACAEWYIHNPAHHPEGSTEDFYGTVYDHVLESIRIADVVNLSPLEKLCVMFHDIGKGYCAKNYSAEHPYHNFIAHDVYGVRIMDCIGKRLNFESLDLDIIKFCIQHHMRFYKLREMRQTKVEYLVNHKYFNTLACVCFCDSASRGNLFSFGDFYWDLQIALIYRRK